MNRHTDRGFARRTFLGGAAGSAILLVADGAIAKIKPNEPVNLALVAAPESTLASTDTKLSALNSGMTPHNSADRRGGFFRTESESETGWVEYRWAKPITTNRVDVYWLEGWGDACPQSCRLSYWNGTAFVPVPQARGLGVLKDQFNTTHFEPVRTDRLRLEFTPNGQKSAGVLQWKVISVGRVPDFPPVVDAGVDRMLIVGGQTYLAGRAEWLKRAPGDVARWTQLSGPSPVAFADPTAPHTTAKAAVPGDYVVQLEASGKTGTQTSALHMHVDAAPPAKRLDVVYTTPYAIDSPLWSARAKALIVNWIPHCIEYCERTDLKDGQGGLDNFIEAAKALRGEPHGVHKGYVFSNAWVHQTIESMCIALMVDAQGDREIAAAQAKMRATLEKWIPIVLAAQEPDGYLQTAFTLADRKAWPERWSPKNRGDHEGYVAGYFIESAINHHTLTGGKDLRLYNAAKKLADCWVANIGPGKKAWFDGHQEMEQALVRFGRFVNDMEGHGHGDAYIGLARFLLESRKGGSEYDQSHVPPEQQYEAVGHAVRAMYFYSGMADIAAETGDRDYQSAVMSLWDNMVNRKYYLTGGVGSGDTAEGFGVNYALRNDAYCESCSSCGLIFFQYKLNLAYHDAKYADLYEETIYNALLGSVDLEGRNFTYTNPLEDRSTRYAWHNCPCCVGNIPRTLLMMPTWAYVKDASGIFVNLFIGSRIDVGEVAGTKVQIAQKTNYPWDGAVAITVNPAEPREFAVRVRIPNRQTSRLYRLSPEIGGLRKLTVNGKPVEQKIEKGYAVITRRWKKGDRIELELPLAAQRVTANERIEAARGKIALRYGPLVYCVETADQPRLDGALSAASLSAQWRPDLLGGVTAISGTWQDGSQMLAIPYYARTNRAGPATEFPVKSKGPVLSQVWMAT